MTGICAVDTETTSLRLDRRAWEIGIIVREVMRVRHPDGPDTYEPFDAPHRWFVAAEDLDLGNADPMSLKIGRFHERHPDFTGKEPRRGEYGREAAVLREVEQVIRGAHLVGAVVSFDAEVLGARMRANGICPSWHYHLIDVEALAVGAIATRAARLEGNGQTETARVLREAALPPWKSDDLSQLLGVTVSEEDRHTALGDARWALRIYDAVMGGAS